MKTQHFFIALLGFSFLMFSACQEDAFTDKAAPANKPSVDTRGGTDFTMTADLLLAKSSVPRTASFGIATGQRFHAVRGYGEAFSEELGQAQVRASFQYYPDAELLEGTVNYDFSNGAISMRLVGKGLELYEAPDIYAITTEADVISASGEYDGIIVDANATFIGAENLTVSIGNSLTVSQFQASLVTSGMFTF